MECSCDFNCWVQWMKKFDQQAEETYIFILLLIVTWYRTCGIAEGLEEFSQKNRGVLE